jgi:TnpA family transposase
VRRRVQLQLNRGNSRHDLARWLFFANQGEFRTGGYEEIMNKASCLSLLSNAVLVWNTVRMGEIVARLRAAGETVSDDGRVAVLVRVDGSTVFMPRARLPYETDASRRRVTRRS